MGQAIAACVEEAEDIELCCGTESPGHPAVGRDLGEVTGLGTRNITVSDTLEDVIDGCDVLIDFTTPECSMTTLKIACEKGKAVVFGTTGFSAVEKEAIIDASSKMQIVVAPNMSIGVNVLFKAVRDVAKALGDEYDVEIVEAHHKFKKDAPSGTAVRISEIVADALQRNLYEVGVYGRKGFTEGRDQKEIGVHTVRAGDIVGEHRVIFGGMGESLELFHRAQSRETFARGAVRAAQWLVNQPEGLYDMQDVLGLKGP